MGAKLIVIVGVNSRFKMSIELTLNVFLQMLRSSVVEITSCLFLHSKTIVLFNLGESCQNIYLDFQE